MVVGMAQGADLLVAQTALALGVRVEAVLPMPLDQYAADFDAETLASLKALLQHPDIRCDVLSSVSIGEALPEHSAAQRDAMYANLTDALIRRSSLLLALWDGRASHLSGGTADTVLRYLGVRTDASDGLEPIEFIETREESDCAVPLVYWTPTARSGIARASDCRTPCFLLGVGENVLQLQRTMPSWLKRQLADLNSYNLEFRRLSDAARLPTAHSLMGALPVSVPLAARGPLENIDAQYRKADALAVHYQRRSDRLFDLFAITAFAMGLAYLVYDKLVESWTLLIGYLLTLLGSLGVYHVLQGKRWFGKHLTYRALAETLRARFYLRLAGTDQRVDATEVLALSGIDKFRGFGWIGFVLKGIEPADVRALTCHELDVREECGAEQTWIERSEEHTSELQSRLHLVCRLLLEKKKKKKVNSNTHTCV